MSNFSKDSTVLVNIDGRVVTQPKLLNSYGLTKVFKVYIETKRKSGKVDTFQVQYSSELGVVLNVNDFICVHGDIRTKSKKNSRFVKEGYILANNIDFLSEEPEIYTNNCIIRYCNFYKFLGIRKSYDGSDSDVADYIISVRRKHSKMSYFRATSWNHDAIFIGNMHSNIEFVDIECKLQSYATKYDDSYFISLDVHHFNVLKNK